MSFLDHPGSDEVMVGGEKTRANLIYATRPDYPIEACWQRETGYGVFILRFRPDGSVSEIVALKSTGIPALDRQCLATFRLWRCRPGVHTTIQVPIRLRCNRGRLDQAMQRGAAGDAQSARAASRAIASL